MGQIPMDRSGGEASAKSLENIAAVLKEDHLIAIYPEGTRSVDGRMYRGKTGVARIALLAEAPVIPVGVSGTATKSRFLGINWPGKPQVTVGEPLLFSDQYANKNDPEVLRYVTDEIMAAIQQITGQQYVDIYGYRVKHGDLKNSDCTEFVKERPGD
ncbi:MAG: hypothetical protein CR979_03475 [Propionibacterium sp.]|nr:MAG: hypothetical protein CR979_03475 [Propionibacterium sp.]